MLTKTEAEQEVYLRTSSDLDRLKSKGIEITVERINQRIDAAIEYSYDLYTDAWPLDIDRGRVLQKLSQIHPPQTFSSLSKDREKLRWLKHKKSESKVGDWKFWNAYKEFLGQKRDENEIRDTEDVIDEILDLSGDPLVGDQWLMRGLVLGNVQSGKTENYLGLINKACDVGYRVIILLGGHINELRNQTQLRVDEGVVGRTIDPNKDVSFQTGVSSFRDDEALSVMSFTKVKTISNKGAGGGGDFSTKFKDANAARTLDPNQISIFVIKKNKGTFDSLIKFLSDTKGLDNGKSLSLPLLLIDDEADWGSINSKASKNEVTAYNKSTRTILNLFKKATYVGYTATPFANIFIDPENQNADIGRDLFPEDFLVRMPPPHAYSGQEDYFGNITEVGPHSDNKSLIYINDNENLLPLSHKSDTPLGEIPESLKEAIRVFVLVTAIRGHREGTTEFHNSMLVNISHITKHQRGIYSLIDTYLINLKNAILSYGALPISKAILCDEIGDIESTYSVNYPYLNYDFEVILKTLRKTIQKIEILVVNADGGLDYSEHPKGLSVIAIGGHKLSRGFTLEGLSVSYFARSSKGYDTLMQMCRWFGYRPNYFDCCRVFIPEESADWYNFITKSMDELDLMLEHMKQAKSRPEDFGLKIRKHPGAMLVTARNKLGTAEEELASMHLWGQTYRGFRFYKDKKTNDNNLDLFKAFITKLKNTKDVVMQRGSEEENSPWIFSGVEYDDLIEIISTIKVAEDKHIPKSILIDQLKLMKNEDMSMPRVGLYNVDSKTLWWQENIKSQTEKDFMNSEYKFLDFKINLSKRAMKTDGEIVFQPGSELRGKLDEKYFIEDITERDRIEQTSEKLKNESFLYSPKRNFPAVMFYLFALGEGAAKLRKEDQKNAEVSLSHGLKPSLGFSVSIPILGKHLGKTKKEIERLNKESSFVYLTNKTMRQEVLEAEQYDPEYD